MSDRIALMTPRPWQRHVQQALDSARPRQRNSPPFLELRAAILEMLHFTGKAEEGL
jgi:NitT/TauT family transport system ATP-binding protein/sulfonate transport system ATP-binding protein